VRQGEGSSVFPLEVKKLVSARGQFWIFIAIVMISGFSQGMLLPLIAVIFEHNGLSSSLNGLNATATYIGILLMSPFMEYPLRKYGYKTIILTGGLMVVIALFLFPFWHSFWFWFVLRLLVGVGDNALHFGTSTWITSYSPVHKRGRNLSIYGVSFGIGFAIGPLMTPLVEINQALPFVLSSVLCLIGWCFVLLIKNDYPDETVEIGSFLKTLGRFSQAWKYAWVALLPPLGYGFLEASLNGSFPVYALRTELDVESVSILLTSFAIGGIVFQIPLGILSDRFGRRNVLLFILLAGAFIFEAAILLEHTLIGLCICIFIAGMLLGSTFSMGISYMTDLVPRQLIPAGNLMCNIFYSIGSLIGPFCGGLFIELFPNISFFQIISVILVLLFIAVFFYQQKIHQL
jgi:MFS family permease